MDEKIKNRMLIYVIVVLTLFVLILSIAGIVGYKSLIKKIYNIEQNKMNSVENILDEDNNEIGISILEESNKEGNWITKTIQLNENDYDVKLEVTYDKIDVEDYSEIDYENYYNSKYNVSINSKVVSGIKEKVSCKGKVKETDIAKIADINGKEYLLVYTYVYNPANISYINTYVIDPTESNKIIGVVEHKDNVSYSIDEDTRLEFEVNSNNIIDYIYNSEENILEKHKYVIENGILKDTVEKTYNKDRLTAAGAV